MSYQALEINRDGEVAWLTLNRPQALNALNAVMVDELHDYLRELYHDRDTRVVVVRGAGRAFCAGLDLKEQSGGGTIDVTRSSTANVFDIQRKMSDLVVAIRRLPQPFIAAVRGPASGGGFALALAADVRLAAESARFNAAFIKIGLSACDMGVSYFLPRAVGTSIASELMLTGRFINASRALATGLVSEVVAESELDAAAGTLGAGNDRNVAARFAADEGMPGGERRCRQPRDRRYTWRTAIRLYACERATSRRVRARSSRNASPTSPNADKRIAELLAAHDPREIYATECAREAVLLVYFK